MALHIITFLFLILKFTKLKEITFSEIFFVQILIIFLIVKFTYGRMRNQNSALMFIMFIITDLLYHAEKQHYFYLHNCKIYKYDRSKTRNINFFIYRC